MRLRFDGDLPKHGDAGGQEQLPFAPTRAIAKLIVRSIEGQLSRAQYDLLLQLNNREPDIHEPENKKTRR